MSTSAPRSALARRVALYELAALPADALVTSFGLGADECFGYLLDHVETRDSAEARRVEEVLRAAEVSL